MTEACSDIMVSVREVMAVLKPLIVLVSFDISLLWVSAV